MTHNVPHEELLGMDLQQYEDFLKKGVEMALRAASNGRPKNKHDRRIGAVVVSDDHQFISAGNIEFDTIGNFCAEKLAILKACEKRILFDPTEKNPGAYLKAIFIATQEKDHPIPPCGDCAQMIYRTALNENALVICAGKNGIDFDKKDGGIEIYRIRDIRPVPYKSDTTKKAALLKARHEKESPLASRYVCKAPEIDNHFYPTFDKQGRT